MVKSSSMVSVQHEGEFPAAGPYGAASSLNTVLGGGVEEAPSDLNPIGRGRRAADPAALLHLSNMVNSLICFVVLWCPAGGGRGAAGRLCGAAGRRLAVGRGAAAVADRAPQVRLLADCTSSQPSLVHKCNNRTTNVSRGAAAVADRAPQVHLGCCCPAVYQGVHVHWVHVRWVHVSMTSQARQGMYLLLSGASHATPKHSP